MVCATVCLTVVPSFSDITDVSTIGHSSKTDRSRTPLFHVVQYGDDIIGRELNLRKPLCRQWESNPQPSEQLRPITIKTHISGGKLPPTRNAFIPTLQRDTYQVMLWYKNDKDHPALQCLLLPQCLALRIHFSSW